MSNEKSSFEVLSSINVESHVKGKNGFKYLPWASAVGILLDKYPDATWSFREWDEKPYLKTETGCFVEASVTVGANTRSQLHPVLDYRNQPILEPNAFQINTSMQRALAKAIALHGLALYIFQGEDVPHQEIEDLRSELRSILQSKEKLTKEADAFINKMDMAMLNKKIKENK